MNSALSHFEIRKANMQQTKLLLLASLVLLFTVLIGHGQTEEIIPGGVTQHDLPATPEIHQMIRDMHPKIMSHLKGLPGATNVITKLKPISYRTQLVNGVNYFVKVGVRTPKKVVYYHLRIYKSFGGQPKLMKVVGPKRLDDFISYF